MSTPFEDPLLHEVRDIAIALTEPDLFPEEAQDETIDGDDWAPAPEFSGFEVWCEEAETFAAEWRPSPDGPWFCRLCGGTDHARYDNEEI